MSPTTIALQAATNAILGTNTDTLNLNLGYILTQHGTQLGQLTFTTHAKAQSYLNLLTDELDNTNDIAIRAAII